MAANWTFSIQSGPGSNSGGDEFLYFGRKFFALKQNLELFDFYHFKLEDCVAAIEAHVERLVRQAPPPTTKLPRPRRGGSQLRRNEPRFDMRTYPHRLTGTDLSQIHGIGPYSALQLISENRHRYDPLAHGAEFHLLAHTRSHNKITGGRVISSSTTTSANRAAEILRMAAMSAGKIQTALGASYRRLVARTDSPKPSPPTGCKIAHPRLPNAQRRTRLQTTGPDVYDARQRQRASATCDDAP